MTRAFYGDSNPATALDLTMLGRALEFQNRFEEATRLPAALAIRERVYGGASSVASTLNESETSPTNTTTTTRRSRITRESWHLSKDLRRQALPDRAGISNLATAIYGKKDYPRAEQLTGAVRRYTAAQGRTTPTRASPAWLATSLARAAIRRGAGETRRGTTSW